MRTFIRYIGGKHELAKRYGPPRRPVVVEPFAGSAGYSVWWNAPKAILFDKNERLIAVWKWLIAASRDDIMDLDPDISDIETDCPGYPQVVKDFIGWNFSSGQDTPTKRPSPLLRRTRAEMQAKGVRTTHIWGRDRQRNIAEDIHLINDWEAHVGDYSDAPAGDFHYHVDPPYQKMGDRLYRHNGKRLDFQALAEWCKSKDCIDVCEGTGADWLPFDLFRRTFGSNKKEHYDELLWRKGGRLEHPLLINTSKETGK